MTDTLLAIGAMLALLALGVSFYGAARQRGAEKELIERQHKSEDINATLLSKFNGTVTELAQVRELLATAVAEQGRLRPALDAALTEIVRLRTALDVANAEIALLRNAIHTKVPNARPIKPLLLIQCEPTFGDVDAQAIRRTGIPFQRRAKCTAETFDMALQTGREDGQTPMFLHISAHMSASRIKFFDQDKGIEWLSQRIRGVHTIFLAGCENEEIGAALVATNISQHVITMTEPVENQDASNFTFAFWRAISEGVPTPEAFEQALGICPQVSEFVQLRSARRR